MTENATQTRSYPWTTRLSDVEVTFRRMTAEDFDAVLAFTRSLPEHDLLFLRIDITQPETIRAWIENIERGVTQTILAEEKGQLIGYASLHRNPILWTRHMGEIRLLVSSNYRGKGIGGSLARQVFALAQKSDLYKIMVQMMSNQRGAQSIFHHLGFIPEATLNDWVIDRAGCMHSLIVMAREVEDPELPEAGA